MRANEQIESVYKPLRMLTDVEPEKVSECRATFQQVSLVNLSRGVSIEQSLIIHFRKVLSSRLLECTHNKFQLNTNYIFPSQSIKTGQSNTKSTV